MHIDAHIRQDFFHNLLSENWGDHLRIITKLNTLVHKNPFHNLVIESPPSHPHLKLTSQVSP